MKSHIKLFSVFFFLLTNEYISTFLNLSVPVMYSYDYIKIQIIIDILIYTVIYNLLKHLSPQLLFSSNRSNFISFKYFFRELELHHLNSQPEFEPDKCGLTRWLHHLPLWDQPSCLSSSTSVPLACLPFFQQRVWHIKETQQLPPPLLPPSITVVCPYVTRRKNPARSQSCSEESVTRVPQYWHYWLLR